MRRRFLLNNSKKEQKPKPIYTYTYTTTDGNMLKGISGIDHTYEDGIGKISTYSTQVLSFVGQYTLETVVIPDGVKNIRDYAFDYCTGLTSVTIPNSVTSIGGGAFYGCSGLKSITIPSSVTDIQSEAFIKCVNLIDIIIPECAINIAYHAFYDTAWYNNQPDGVVYLGKILYVYKGTMPKDTSVNIKKGTLGIAEHAFFDQNDLINITIPDSVINIGYGAFKSCESLTTVTIPEGIKSIGSEAFAECSNLESIVVVEENSVYDSRNNCNAIIETATNTLIAGCKNSVIPNGVTTIGAYIFRSYAFQNITIPDSVTNIRESAFLYCNITNITIGNGIKKIGSSAFYQCSINEVRINDLVAWCDIDFVDAYSVPFSSNSKLYLKGELVTDLIIPEGVEKIKNYTFADCSSLTSVIIPNSVVSIGKRTFANCANLINITIPNSVTSIENQAFAMCRNLTEIMCLNTVAPSIENYTFGNVSQNGVLKVPNGSDYSTWLEQLGEGWTIEYIEE